MKPRYRTVKRSQGHKPGGSGGGADEEQGVNASDLYNIVKDLPQEAKPRRIVGFARGCWFILQTAETGDKPVCVDSFLFPEEAEMLFEASMVRWLCRKLMSMKGMPRVSIVAPEDGEDRWRVFRSDRTHCIGVENTLIEALAAACKAVSNA